MTNNEPTPEQAAIIQNEGGHRIRLVSAAPGSGKTWMVARAIQHEVQGRPERHPGLAALSFTNVAKEEVLSALGGAVGPRHFVGTIDSFLHRFVLRPFLPSIAKTDEVWRVVPETLTSSMNAEVFKHTLWRNGKPLPPLNLFDCTVTGTRKKPNVAVKHPTSRQPLDLTPGEVEQIHKAKRKVWFRYGLMSHSDAAFIAANSLEGEHGQTIRTFICDLFPFLVVDELQDTGDSHSRCLRALLAEERIRAILVGDPDQSIYEFSGASPARFDSFKELPGVGEGALTTSRRCPQSICAVACALSSTGRDVQPRVEVPTGSARLLVHDEDPTQTASFAASLPTNAKVLVRKNKTKAQLLGGSTPAEPAFGSQPLQRLFRAVGLLLRGETRAAIELGAHGLANAAYGLKTPATLGQYQARGTTRHEVKGQALLLLMDLVPEPNTEPLKDWGLRAHQALLDAATSLPNGQPKGRSIRRPGKKLRGAWSKPERGARQTKATVSTVHGAKGETHDTSVYYVPKVNQNRCPSREWWTESGSEERRIAFVACTRPREKLILCIHRSSFNRLSEAQPEFIQLFEVQEMGEYLEQQRQDASTGVDAGSPRG